VPIRYLTVDRLEQGIPDGRHIHFTISAPGHQRLVTHVLETGDKYLDSDVVFGVKDGLVRVGAACTFRMTLA
jgi:protocatechuate 3,4-dioxygenase beta subunit